MSVTYNVEPSAISRECGSETGAFDWGLKTLLTIANADGSIETVDNPRWLKRKLSEIRALQRVISAEETKMKVAAGLAADAPIPAGTKLGSSQKLKRLYALLGKIHSKVARQRHDFYHKLTALLVARFGALGTETLGVKKMVKRPKAVPDLPRVQSAACDPDRPGEFLPNGAGQKAKLNRSTHDAAPSTLVGMLLTKAAEAGSIFAQANTFQVKPTQRCHCCGRLVPKELSERTHRCDCGTVCDRDENAARTLLRWLQEGEFWVGVQSAGLKVKRTGTVPCGLCPQETPALAACG